MKLTTIALAAAFALSSTCALAYTNHHKTHHARASTYYGNPNNRGGLVGGDDPGTSASYARMQPQPGWNNNGWNNNWNNNGWNNNYGQNNYGGSNNRRGLVGGSDTGTYRP